MNDALMYFLKVNIAIALFYLFYRLFFANDTFWKTRRIYLLASIGLSFVYPFLSIQNWLQQQEPMQSMVYNYSMLPEIVITPKATTRVLSFDEIGMLFYGFISFVLVIRLVVQLISIGKIFISGKRRIVQGVSIIAIDRKITPFSFFGTVYMNPELHNEHETEEILAHELTHVRQMHSLDVLIGELLIIAFWINPAIWLLKKEIRHNLEFLADNKVLESGFDSKSYQYHLLQLSYQTPDLKLTNKFNISPLKKRIIMMNQQKTSKAGMLKYLLIVPLALSLVVTSNAESLISSAKKVIKDEAKAETNKTASNTIVMDEMAVVSSDTTPIKMKDVPPPPPPPPAPGKDGELVPPPPPPPVPKDVVFQVVEKMPQFEGGDESLFKYLSENVRYPVEAQKKGIQGRVICSFVIKSSGIVDSVKILRSVDPSLDAEAIRVVKAMPKWTPGEQRGQKVNVQYTLPIAFKLDGGPVTNPWGDKPIVFLDGYRMGPNFNQEIIKPESIDKIEVQKPDTEEAKKELISKYGKWAGNGVIKITTKK
jgi:TonB family protein